MGDGNATISFFCPGQAAPGGSKRAFYIKALGRAIITDAAPRNKPWRASVAASAQAVYFGPPLDGPLAITAQFGIARPKGHFGTGRNAGKLRASAPRYPTGRPDASKLWRAAEDALTKILWRDDAQIVWQTVTKNYSDRPGLRLEVQKLDNANPAGDPGGGHCGRAAATSPAAGGDGKGE